MTDIGFAPAYSGYDMQGNKIRNLGTPTNPSDAFRLQDYESGNQATQQAIASLNSRIDTIEAQQATDAEVQQAIINYIQSTEKAVNLTGGVTNGNTRTFTITHTFNSQDVALLSLRILSTNKTIFPGSFDILSPTQVSLSFTSSTLPEDNTLRALIKKVGA